MDTPESQEQAFLDFHNLLAKKFPQMKKIKSTPGLFTFNGFGTSMSGKRDYDQETSTYVKSHVITALFVPICTLGSYRVTDVNEGGWHFLGKVPVSGFAKGFNMIIAVIGFAISSSIGYGIYSNSPGVRMEAAMTQAQELVVAGAHRKAATAYRDAISIDSSKKNELLMLYNGQLNHVLANGSPQDQAWATAHLISAPYWNTDLRKLHPDLYSETLERVRQNKEAAPRAALSMINNVTRLAGTDIQWLELKKSTLEKLVSSSENPSLSHLTKLVSLYSDAGDSERIVALLRPLSPLELKSELPRIYGAALLNLGDFSAALEQLEAYCQPRLADWSDAQSNYNTVLDQAYNRALAKLNDGSASDRFYRRYENANEARQEEMVNDYISKQYKSDNSLQAIERKLTATKEVPNALMDLGLVYLRMGQSLSPEEGKTYLVKAETTLTQIGGYAGESSEYQFFLGQVYYWLGKSEKAEKLFDVLIGSQKDDADSLQQIAQILREVGETEKAQEVFTTAYSVAKIADVKNSIAISLSILASDQDESIEWLKKADQTDPNIITRLYDAEASKAWSDGDEAAAIKNYRKALDGYQKQQENATTLNNSSLIHFNLFSLTGEINHYQDGITKIEKAVKLQPNDSILCSNASSNFLSAAVLDQLRPEVSAPLLRGFGGMSDLRLFYNNEAEKEQIMQKLAAHPHYKKSQRYLQKTMMLAPEDRSALSQATSLSHYMGNAAELIELSSKINLSEKDKQEAQEKWRTALDEFKIEDSLKYRKINIQRLNSVLKLLKDDKSRNIQEARIAAAETSSALWRSNPQLEAQIEKLKKCYAKHPCSEIESAIVDASMANALLSLYAKNPALKVWLDDGKMTLSYTQLMILAALKEPSILKDPTVTVAFQRHKNFHSKYPKSYNAEDCIVYLVTKDPGFESKKSSFMNDPISRASHDFSISSRYGTSGDTIATLWDQLLEGASEEAMKNYKKSSSTNSYLPKAFKIQL